MRQPELPDIGDKVRCCQTSFESCERRFAGSLFVIRS